MPTDGACGSAHGRAGRESVVDQDHRAVAQVDRGAAVAIELLASHELPAFDGRGALDVIVSEFQLGDDRVVEHTDTAARDRAEGQLLMARNTELAHEKQIERRREAAGELEADRHAASRQREHAATSSRPL